MDQHAGPQRLFEDAQQVQFVGQKGCVVFDRQPVVDDGIAFLYLGFAFEQPFQQRFVLEMHRL